jgi:hypothetical protein
MTTATGTASYPISLSDIMAANTATSSNQLSLLSTTAIEAGNVSTLNDAPYAMSEFLGYTHSSPYSNVGPDTVIIGGAASGYSMRFWSDGFEFQNNFAAASFIAGFDVRFRVYQQYTYPTLRTNVLQSFQRNANNGVYRNTSNTDVTMSTSSQPTSHFQSNLSGLDYMSTSTGFDEFKLAWSNTSISITGDTANAFASVGQQNIGSHTAIANGTWYAIGPEGNLGTYGTTINLYGGKGLGQTGSASISTILTLETWVRNTGLAKSETKIRTQDIYLQGDATVLSGGGGCPLCCVHDSMLIATEEDMKSIYDIQIGDKVISHNFETGKDEVVEVTDIIIVDRDVDYKINDLVMTEDHPVYLEGGRKASLNPDATLLNYKQEVDQLVIGDRMMKLDGTLEEITSIEKFEGEHKNFAVQTKHNNFYANGHLVDSVINRGTK